MLPSLTTIAALAALAAAQVIELSVETSTGTVTGLVNGTTPAVRQFLSIPFAQPPVDSLRWLPPQPLDSDASEQIDATQYPPSCPQFLSAVPSVYNEDVTPWIPYRYDQPAPAGASLQTSSEDCLYLAIWTPTNATNTSSLPVLFFITGGAFLTNGIDVPAQIPNHWVQRTQSHIVVTINYRLNIFGFPNAATLEDQNLGLLDQRAALEWVRTNIAAFGGDPARITLWGQSAGAISVDYQNFYRPDDPIVSSFFAQSGSVYLDITSKDTTQSNFTFMADNLGCQTSNDTERLQCMRNVSFVDIENFLGRYRDNSTLVDPSQPSLLFAPVADEKVVFSNYTERYSQGSYANLPFIYSSTAMEGEALVTYPEDPATMGPNLTEANATTNSGFLCPAALSSMLREAQNATTPTYRYVFSGNFSNVSPRFWMGAYHASDLAFLFGTHQDLQTPGTNAGSTQQEFAVSEAMQDHVLEFASTRGYPQTWPTYRNGSVVEFGRGDQVQEVLSVQDVDATCAS